MNSAVQPPPARHWRRLGVAIAWGLVLFAVYALSAGPAVMLMQRRVLPQTVVEAVYLSPHAPLQLVVSVLPGGEAAMHWYVRWWETGG